MIDSLSIMIDIGEAMILTLSQVLPSEYRLKEHEYLQYCGLYLKIFDKSSGPEVIPFIMVLLVYVLVMNLKMLTNVGILKCITRTNRHMTLLLV